MGFEKIIKLYVLNKFITVLASFVSNLTRCKPVDRGLNIPALPS